MAACRSTMKILMLLLCRSCCDGSPHRRSIGSTSRVEDDILLVALIAFYILFQSYALKCRRTRRMWVSEYLQGRQDGGRFNNDGKMSKKGSCELKFMGNKSLLVKEIAKHGCLWDVCHYQYRFKGPSKSAWAKIADSTGRSVEECKLGWRAIRDITKSGIPLEDTNIDVEHADNTEQENDGLELSDDVQFLYEADNPQKRRRTMPIPSSTSACGSASPITPGLPSSDYSEWYSSSEDSSSASPSFAGTAGPSTEMLLDASASYVGVSNDTLKLEMQGTASPSTTSCLESTVVPPSNLQSLNSIASPSTSIINESHQLGPTRISSDESSDSEYASTSHRDRDAVLRAGQQIIASLQDFIASRQAPPPTPQTGPTYRYGDMWKILDRMFSRMPEDACETLYMQFLSATQEQVQAHRSAVVQIAKLAKTN